MDYPTVENSSTSIIAHILGFDNTSNRSRYLQPFTSMGRKADDKSEAGPHVFSSDLKLMLGKYEVCER